MKRRALILTGKLVQDHEYIYPYYRVQEEGYEVDVAVRGKELVLGIIGSKIVPTLDIPDVKIDDYDILILPGGAKAMEYMRQDTEILKIISDFNATGKVIASICHAAQLLISAKVVKGRKISGYYSIKDDINNAGATYVDGPAVVDANIVSCPHYKHLGPWMKEALALVEKRAAAKV
ncbi:MAG: DJ-1/PfpI/YhbO family deglycase/protease [Candidatus Omnitrophota bacterium]|nr:DJ-1/PfpI/YhbO family deglycase/protease [Candidatus Omnitrophota bacterium]